MLACQRLEPVGSALMRNSPFRRYHNPANAWLQPREVASIVDSTYSKRGHRGLPDWNLIGVDPYAVYGIDSWSERQSGQERNEI